MTPKQLMHELDHAPTSFRYWRAVVILFAITMADYFDFFLAAFLVAVVAPAWHLTFQQISIMLVSAGVGGMVGALVSGYVSDRIGRKWTTISAVLICGLFSSSIALVSDGDWITFSVLRFFVGFGLAGAATPCVSLIVEYSPLRVRTIVGGLQNVSATLGVLLASALTATLYHTLGWRGMAATGLVSVALGLLAIPWIPESVRWLISSGRLERGRKGAEAWLGRAIPPIEIGQRESGPDSSVPETGYIKKSTLFMRLVIVSIMWMFTAMVNIGVYSWGPTIVSMVMSIPLTQVGHVFVIVSSFGIAGKIFFSFLAKWIGRRPTGQIAGAGMAVFLTAVAVSGDSQFLGIPLFVAFLAISAIFFDGIFANVVPYTAELFPVRISSRAVGVGQAANGAGKIIGPMMLAAIAGKDSLVTRDATIAAAFPGFMALAACGIGLALAFTTLRVETKNKTLA